MLSHGEVVRKMVPEETIEGVQKSWKMTSGGILLAFGGQDIPQGRPGRLQDPLGTPLGIHFC